MALKSCPKCGRTYAEETLMCEDCEEALVEAEETTLSPSGDIVPLTTVEDVEEAMVLTNVLKSQGIQAIIEDVTLLFGTLGASPSEAGGVRVLVNSEDAQAALELLERHRRGELALSEDEEPEAAE